MTDRSQELEVNPAARASEEMYEAHERIYDPAPVRRDEHAESSFTRLLEQQTARIPSHYFLFAAFCSMGIALTAELAGRRRISRFVGMWSPTLLTFGVYNKLVKTFGLR